MGYKRVYKHENQLLDMVKIVIHLFIWTIFDVKAKMSKHNISRICSSLDSAGSSHFPVLLGVFVFVFVFVDKKLGGKL